MFDKETKVMLSRTKKQYNAYFHSTTEIKTWEGMQVIASTQPIDIDVIEILIKKYPNILRDKKNYKNISDAAWNPKLINRAALILLLCSHHELVQ